MNNLTDKEMCIAIQKFMSFCNTRITLGLEKDSRGLLRNKEKEAEIYLILNKEMQKVYSTLNTRVLDKLRG